MLIKGGIFIMALLWAAVPLLAQDTTVQLTMKDAIDLGIKNSKQLKSSRARIDEAIAAVRQAKDQQLPDFKLSGTYLRVDNPNISMKSSSNNNSGGSGSGSGSGNSLGNLSVSQAMIGQAALSLPLYSGLRIQYGIESAKYLEKASWLDADNDRDAVQINIINAYINLYKAKAAVDLVKENLLQSKQRDSDFANLEKNGLIARNDLLKAQLQTSNIELSLLDAENSRDLANINMNLLLGLPEKAALVLDSNSLSAPLEAQSIEEYEQKALQNRKDMQALALRGKGCRYCHQIGKRRILSVSRFERWLYRSRYTRIYQHHQCRRYWRRRAIQPFIAVEDKGKSRRSESPRTGNTGQ